MKKALSVILAILMLCTALSVGSFAEETTAETTTTTAAVTTSAWFGPQGSGAPATYDQVVFAFNTNGGTLKAGVQYPVYDSKTGAFVYTDGKDISGTYYMVPQDANSMKEGSLVSLPAVDAPKGWQFDGWYCESCAGIKSIEKQTLGAATFIIPEGSRGHMIQFSASFRPETVEADTMSKVIEILSKVFGAIVGLLVWQDVDSGIVFMKDIFTKVFG